MNQQSKLSEYLEKETIADMSMGKIYYCVPYGARPEGTEKTAICRKSDCVLVDKHTLGDHKFSRGGNYYVGGANPIPVVLVDSLP